LNNTELRSDIIYEISNADNETIAVYFESSMLIEIIPLGFIEDFPNLSSIIFHESKIPILRANFFTKVFNKIKEILLKENGIQQIEDEAFHKLENLEEIDLSFNEIKSINKELFSQNENLKVINLNGNKIFMIQRNSFEQQPNLREFNLQGNECINRKLGCALQYCHVANETNEYLKNCYSNYYEQEKKSDECKLLYLFIYIIILL
jgi:Leucine-rich repeat (LRR) protein